MALFGSNTRMNAPHDTDARLTELEIKASYAEDLLEQLNTTIYRQQQQIDLLLREVTGLRQQLPEGSQPVLRNLRDELPPHY
jgi:SlyX protein